MKRKNLKKESAEQRHKRYLAIYRFEYRTYLNDLRAHEASTKDLYFWPEEMPANWEPERPAMSLKQAEKALSREGLREDDLRDQYYEETYGKYGLGPEMTPWDFI